MRPRAASLVAALLGALVGLGAYTFRYAEGLSYFSTDPRTWVPRAQEAARILGEAIDFARQGQAAALTAGR